MARNTRSAGHSRSLPGTFSNRPLLNSTSMVRTARTRPWPSSTNSVEEML
jgi:hypothetical protein